MAGHRQRLGVHHGDVVLVFDIDIDVALAIADGLFRRAAEIERADDGAVLGVDHGGVRGTVAEDPDALVERVEQDAVGAALHVDGLDRRQRFGVPHGDGFAAGEAVIALGVDGGAARVGVGDFAHWRERVQVEDRNAGALPAARDVQAASHRIGIHVVEAAGAAHLGGLDHFVLGQSGGRDHRG